MQFPSASRPTWVEVSLAALRRNFRLTQEHVGPEVTVCAVVKADAYGHGAVECARALEQEGATWLGVTSTDEGVRLREAGIKARILLMTGFWRGEQEAVIQHQLTPAVWQRESIEVLDSAACAAKAPDAAPVHLKIDTGMSRLGVPPDQLAKLCESLAKAKHLRVEGIFTHFASSEIVDGESNVQQLARFEAALGAFRRHGIQPQFIHAANSSAIVALPEARYNFVRPGISLYGYYLPFLSSTGSPSELHGLDVEPVLSWKTRIIGLRELPTGASVGYGSIYTARQPARIAVLPLGYADGLNRKLSSLGRVLIRGQAAPIIGRISMDLTIVDITAIPETEVGEEVTILHNAEGHLDAWEHARLAETVPYETLCAISGRVPRRYL
ncbi:MAG TPA: alanine racemase [Terriglobales bacterium]|nr:alanine racemase [Terriglobales bacterium]